ncbi:protein S100-B-like [Hemiscyllium ocellatum]|uniref:protein S100-B-like n=1 Tax=Hemiscyllium ocellatum TaxID=170820 RepID=UPI002966A9AA|nr:protein S100-B-like [Hemiscyllium ocellatum]
MSDLENAMIAIIKVFHKYTECKRHKLKKTQLKALVNNELNQFIENIKDQATLDTLMLDLDENGDMEIDFQEFVTFVAMITSACHSFFAPQE